MNSDQLVAALSDAADKRSCAENPQSAESFFWQSVAVAIHDLYDEEFGGSDD